MTAPKPSPEAMTALGITPEEKAVWDSNFRTHRPPQKTGREGCPDCGAIIYAQESCEARQKRKGLKPAEPVAEPLCIDCGVNPADKCFTVCGPCWDKAHPKKPVAEAEWPLPIEDTIATLWFLGRELYAKRCERDYAESKSREVLDKLIQQQIERRVEAVVKQYNGQTFTMGEAALISEVLDAVKESK